jgi:hypothetical protein
MWVFQRTLENNPISALEERVENNFLRTAISYYVGSDLLRHFFYADVSHVCQPYQVSPNRWFLVSTLSSIFENIVFLLKFVIPTLQSHDNRWCCNSWGQSLQVSSRVWNSTGMMVLTAILKTWNTDKYWTLWAERQLYMSDHICIFII